MFKQELSLTKMLIPEGDESLQDVLDKLAKKPEDGRAGVNDFYNDVSKKLDNFIEQQMDGAYKAGQDSVMDKLRDFIKK